MASVSAESPDAGAAPPRLNGNGDGWRCPTCGNGPHPLDADLCARGHFRAGNQVARQLGLYARQQPAELRERVDRLTAGILSDLGGEDELSTLERAYVGRLADVEVTLRLLAHDIAERGLLTPSGGVRRVYDQLLAGIDRWDRLTQRIGVKRRARRVSSAMEATAAMPEIDA